MSVGPLPAWAALSVATRDGAVAAACRHVGRADDAADAAEAVYSALRDATAAEAHPLLRGDGSWWWEAPAWNDLPEVARVAAGDEAQVWADDGGQCALEVYRVAREGVPRDEFPLFKTVAPPRRPGTASGRLG